MNSPDATTTSGDRFHTLLVLEDIILKATGADLELTFRNLERRLFLELSRTFAARARAAVRAAVRSFNRQVVRDTGPVLAAMAARFEGWGDEMLPLVRATTSESYRAGKDLIRRKARGEISRRLEPDSPHQRERVIKQGEFGPRDERAVRALTSKQVFWIGRHYDENLSRRLGALTSDIMLERGLGRREASKLLRESLEAEFGLIDVGFERDGIRIPEGWTGTSAQYFEGLAANTVTTGRSHGSMAGLVEVGATRYEVVNALDERTCARCRFMDGKVLDVRAASGRMVEEVEANDPNDIRRIHPWATSAAALQAAEAGRGLVEAGHGYPPFHMSCRCGIDIATTGFDDLEPFDVDEGDLLPEPAGEPPPTLASPPPPPAIPPPRLDPRDGLAAAMAQDDAKAIRRELRAIAEPYGSNHLFVGSRFRDVYEVKTKSDMANGALGYHTFDGKIAIREDVHKGATEFMRIHNVAAKEGLDFNDMVRSGGSALPDMADDMATLVHEELHDRSPGLPRVVYSGVGMVVEEVTTEVVAKKAMRETFGLDPKFFPQMGRPGPATGSYSDYIHRTYDGLQRNMELAGVEISADEAYRRIESAAVAFKRDTSLMNRTPDEHASAFINKIDMSDIPDPRDREIVRKAMLRELSIFTKLR